MALNKEIVMETGITTSYHVLSALHWYPQICSAHVDISSYISREACMNGAAPVIVRQFELSGGSYPFDMETATAGDVYSELLQTELFCGAALA